MRSNREGPARTTNITQATLVRQAWILPLTLADLNTSLCWLHVQCAWHTFVIGIGEGLAADANFSSNA